MNESTGAPDSTRNNGVDLLRIVAMLMVVMLHCLGHGGVLDTADRSSSSGILLWGLWGGLHCAVDLFVVTTGWLLVDKRFRPERIFLLWLQVLFYSLTIRLAFLVIDNGGSAPHVFRDYWFWNAYLILSLFSPILNAGLIALNSSSPRPPTWILLCCILLAFSVVPAKGLTGYGPFWMFVPYLFGAQLRITAKNSFGRGLFRNITANSLLFLAMALVLPLIGASARFLCLKLSFANPILLSTYSYTSPLVLATSVCWFLFFVRLPIKRLPKWIRMASASSFGVYLIHENPLIREHLVLGRLKFLGSLPFYESFAGIVGASLLVYAICTIIDCLRQKTFIVAKIPALCELACRVIGKKVESICPR